MKYVGWVMAIAVCVSLAIFVKRTVSEAMHDQECRTNLKRIGAALQQYHDRCGSFPPAYVLNKEGQRWHSCACCCCRTWATRICTLNTVSMNLGMAPTTANCWARMPAVYSCPVDGKRAEGIPNYFAIVGPQTVWPEHCAHAQRQAHHGWDQQHGASDRERGYRHHVARTA